MGLCCCKEKKLDEINSASLENSISKLLIENNQINPQDEINPPLMKRKSVNNISSQLLSEGKLIILSDANENNENNENNEIITENLLDTNFDKQINSFIDSIKSYFYIQVHIEQLEVLYKQCDDFGLVFKPYIEILITGHESFRISNNDEEKLNNSGVSDQDHSGLNNSQNSLINSPNVTNLNEGKVYYFKTSKIFQLEKDKFYNSIILSVRNENNIDPNLPAIIIGDMRIPINLLENKITENCFDGQIELELRNNSAIGNLKINLCISSKNFNESDDLFKKISNTKKIINEPNFENLESHVGIIAKPQNSWEQNFTHFFDMNAEDLDKYFIQNISNRENQLEVAKSFYDKVFITVINSNLNTSLSGVMTEEHLYPHINIGDFIKNMEWEFLYKTLKDAIQEENFVLMYELFISFVKLTQLNEFTFINDFFKNLTDDDKNEFFSIPNFTDFNMHIMKLYLIFLHNYQKFFKSNKVKYYKFINF